MPAPIRRDSMSRCEEPSMLYDTIRNPNAPYVPPKPAVEAPGGPKDTIETTQQRLNREMLERFQNTSSRMPHQSFVVAAQAGKYLFLAIMIPPYICFYGIPRWLLMDALPQFFIIAKTESLRVGRFFSEMSKHVVDMMKGLLEQMIGDSLRTMNQGAKNFFGFFAKAAKGVATIVGAFAENVQNVLGAIQERINQTRNRIHAKGKELQDKVGRMKDKVLDAARAVVQTLLYPIDLFDKYLIKPPILWMKNQASAAAKAAHRMAVNTAQAVAKGIKKAVRPFIAAGQTVSHYVSDMLKQAAQYVIQQATDWLKPKLAILERARDKTWRTLAKVGSSIRAKTEETSSAIAESVKHHIQIPIQLMVQAASFAWWMMAPPLSKQWLRLKEGAYQGKRFFKSLGSGISSGVRGIAGQGRWLAKQMVVGAGKLAKLLKKALQWALMQLITLPRKTLRLLVWLLKSMVRFIRFIIYVIRLTVAWVWVVSGYARQLLKELNHEIISIYSR